MWRQAPPAEKDPVGPWAPLSTRIPSDGMTGNGNGAGHGSARNVLSVSRVTPCALTMSTGPHKFQVSVRSTGQLAGTEKRKTGNATMVEPKVQGLARVP